LCIYDRQDIEELKKFVQNLKIWFQNDVFDILQYKMEVLNKKLILPKIVKFLSQEFVMHAVFQEDVAYIISNALAMNREIFQSIVDNNGIEYILDMLGSESVDL